MLIDGYIIKVDYTEQKKLAAAVSRAATNINQICRRINCTGRCYEDDVAELKARQAEIWEPLKTGQGKILFQLSLRFIRWDEKAGKAPGVRTVHP